MPVMEGVTIELARIMRDATFSLYVAYSHT
jgi:hypothetical protein